MTKLTAKVACISIVLLIIGFSIVSAGGPPKLPMSIYGKVIDSDTDNVAPEGSIVKAVTDNGDIITTTVKSSGWYGTPYTERLLIKECDSFELFIEVDGIEVSQGSYNWVSGDIKMINISFSSQEVSERKIEESKEASAKATKTGSVGYIGSASQKTPTSRPGTSSGSSSEGEQTILSSEKDTGDTDKGMIEPTPEPTMKPRGETPTSSILVIFAIVIGTVFVLYMSKRDQLKKQ